jgi:hypothetical protein
MTIRGSIDTGLAFLDALGVVAVRLVVVFCISVVAIIPYAIAFIIVTSTTGRFYLGIIAFVGFVAMTAVLFIDYVYALRGVGYVQEIAPIIRTSPWYVRALALTCSVCALPVVAGGLIFHLVLSERIYLRQLKFDSLLAYFSSVCSFVAGVYAMAFSAKLASVMFDAGGPRSLIDTVLFSLEIITRGFFFDFLEHFRVHVSSFQQSNGYLGLALTYLLRLSSAGFAVSIIFELVKTTKARLEKFEQAESTS